MRATSIAATSPRLLMPPIKSIRGQLPDRPRNDGYKNSYKNLAQSSQK